MSRRAFKRLAVTAKPVMDIISIRGPFTLGIALLGVWGSWRRHCEIKQRRTIDSLQATRYCWWARWEASQRHSGPRGTIAEEIPRMRQNTRVRVDDEVAKRILEREEKFCREMDSDYRGFFVGDLAKADAEFVETRLVEEVRPPWM